MIIALRKYKSLSYLATGLVLTFATGCTDENLDNMADSRLISFDVEGVSPLSLSTRSGDSHSNPVTVLEGYTRPLYLVPVQTEGFPGMEEVGTRASVVDTESLETCAIYARRTDAEVSQVPDYMYNVKISRDNGWSPVDEYLWPGDGKLHFTGFSPYLENPTSEGITSLPSETDPHSISFITPAAVDDQFDLLYCTPVDANSSPCQLTFNHALSAIRFVAGAELAPCVIKSITISNVKSTGTFDLESGEWEISDEKSGYTISVNKSLAAEEKSEYVAPGTSFTDANQFFMLLPQTLGEGTTVSITAAFDGEETTLTASLGNNEWKQGTTTTYRISANPESDSLILDVTGDFTSIYTGSNIPFTVTSTLGTGKESLPVNWKAEFVDDMGNVITQPSWVTDMTSSGEGSLSGHITTTFNDIKFLSISDETRILQSASDINKSSGISPYNLSSSTGNNTVENTANTYIINAPGKYSIPLIYGNAIKNGSNNTEAYIATTKNRYALKNFVNNFGNAITDPYIYNNSGCTPAAGTLLWEDQLNLVQNTQLSSDGKSIVFDIPQNTIRQGNAVVAVKDDSDNILWSWQLWITDYNPSDSSSLQNILGKNVFSRNLGYVTAGDQVEFEACSVKIRFTQTDVPDGLEPLTKTVELTQSGKIKSTEEYNTFYQWGRKDPMWDSDLGAYTASHEEVTQLSTAYISIVSNLNELPQWSIANPDTKMCSKENKALPYNNLWNVNYSTTDNIKSIYDPSPAGYKVALNEPFQDFSKVCTVEVSGNDFIVSSSADPTKLVAPALGYIEPGDGNHTGQGSRAEFWYATIMANRINAGSLVATPTSAQTQTNSPFSGFSVRPVAE